MGDDTMSLSAEVTCRGSWLLGTACGHCALCQDTARGAIDILRAENEQLKQKLTAIVMYVPQGGPGYDISDRFKAQCFDELRRVLHKEQAK